MRQISVSTWIAIGFLVLLFLAAAWIDGQALSDGMLQ